MGDKKNLFPTYSHDEGREKRRGILQEIFLAGDKTEENYTVKNTSVDRTKCTYVMSDWPCLPGTSLLHPLLRFSLRNFPGKRFRMHPMMTIAAKRNRFIEKTLQFLSAVFVNIPTLGNFMVGMKILVRTKHVTRSAGIEFSAV